MPLALDGALHAWRDVIVPRLSVHCAASAQPYTTIGPIFEELAGEAMVTDCLDLAARALRAYGGTDEPGFRDVLPFQGGDAAEFENALGSRGGPTCGSRSLHGMGTGETSTLQKDVSRDGVDTSQAVAAGATLIVADGDRLEVGGPGEAGIPDPVLSTAGEMVRWLWRATSDLPVP